MENEYTLAKDVINQRIGHSDAPSLNARENEKLWDVLKKLGHRIEELTSISQERQLSGYCEVAEGYRRQAAELRTYARSIRKLLDMATEVHSV